MYCLSPLKSLDEGSTPGGSRGVFRKVQGGLQKGPRGSSERSKGVFRKVQGVGFLIFIGLTVSLNRSTHFIGLVVTELVFTISCFTMQGQEFCINLYFDCQVQFIAEVDKLRNCNQVCSIFQ